MSARDRLTRMCGPVPPPELIADLDAYRAEERAKARAEARAEAYRDAADEIEACQAAQDDEERNRHGFLDHETVLQGAAVRDMAAHLRKRADETAPPSALRTAHAALAAQAGRDQAAIKRVRDALDDESYGGPEREDVITAIRAALDGQEPTR